MVCFYALPRESRAGARIPGALGPPWPAWLRHLLQPGMAWASNVLTTLPRPQDSGNCSWTVPGRQSETSTVFVRQAMSSRRGQLALADFKDAVFRVLTEVKQNKILDRPILPLPLSLCLPCRKEQWREKTLIQGSPMSFQSPRGNGAKWGVPHFVQISWDPPVLSSLCPKREAERREEDRNWNGSYRQEARIFHPNDGCGLILLGVGLVCSSAKAWLWPGFSCCFFLSLAKGRIKRRRETRRKRGTHNSSKSDRKRKSERYTISGSKFPIKSVTDLGVKSSKTFYFPRLGLQLSINSCDPMNSMREFNRNSSSHSEDHLTEIETRDFNSWELLYLGLKNWFTVDFNAPSKRILAFYILLFVTLLYWLGRKSQLQLHFQLIRTWYMESFCRARISKVIIRNLCGEGQNDTEESRRFVAGTRNIKERVALGTIDRDISN